MLSPAGNRSCFPNALPVAMSDRSTLIHREVLPPPKVNNMGLPGAPHLARSADRHRSVTSADRHDPHLPPAPQASLPFPEPYSQNTRAESGKQPAAARPPGPSWYEKSVSAACLPLAYPHPQAIPSHRDGCSFSLLSTHSAKIVHTDPVLERGHAILKRPGTSPTARLEQRMAMSAGRLHRQTLSVRTCTAGAQPEGRCAATSFPAA